MTPDNIRAEASSGHEARTRSKAAAQDHEAGRKLLRTVCIPAALAMLNQTDTPLMSFYQKKKREKGAGKAICATARKPLTIIFVSLRKELVYWYLEDHYGASIITYGVYARDKTAAQNAGR